MKYDVCFSCGDVGQLFLRVQQQIDKFISVLNKAPYENDAVVEKLEKVLTDLRHRCIVSHLQQFVYFFVSFTAEFRINLSLH